MKGGKDFQKMQKKNKFPPGFAVAAVGLYIGPDGVVKSSVQ